MNELEKIIEDCKKLSIDDRDKFLNWIYDSYMKPNIKVITDENNNF